VVLTFDFLLTGIVV